MIFSDDELSGVNLIVESSVQQQLERQEQSDGDKVRLGNGLTSLEWLRSVFWTECGVADDVEEGSTRIDERFEFPRELDTLRPEVVEEEFLLCSGTVVAPPVDGRAPLTSTLIVELK